MPRNRAPSARPAVLRSSASRSAVAPFQARASSAAFRRRLVVGLLVLVSLALITVYFREPADGALHGAQNVGATVLRPFEVAAERVAAPFRDLYGWADGLLDARSENAQLRSEVDTWRKKYLATESALQENVKLKLLLDYQEAAAFPDDFRPVNVQVIARPPSLFEQQVVIAAGALQGISLHDPVVTSDGLVGEVTKVFDRSAQVTLLTDPDSAVAAEVLTTGAAGLIRRGPGDGDSLQLDEVPKAEVVSLGDIVITSGTLGGGRLRSLYPKGIEIGVVSSVGQIDTDLHKRIQVDPFVDFSSLHSVAVLVSTDPKPTLP